MALDAGNGLAAKWMPRKGPDAVALRQHFVWTPKFYRKRLVELTKVVEQDMCANRWDGINYSHVPSVAASRYKKAFWKHSPERYKEYVDALTKGDPSVKINASAIFPHDVIKPLIRSYGNTSKVEMDVIVAQWKALPDYVGDNAILPIVDVSGSMTTPVSKNLTALDVSLSLGLYLADKNRGPFKDTFLTFSGSPELLHLKGNIAQKIQQMNSSTWQMNTNLHAAIQKVLDVAVAGNAAPEDMPKYLLVLSDMQFDQCAQYDDSAMKMIRRKYAEAGYEVPNVIFWNLNARDNVPVKFNEKGVGLVSGFSPAILKAILAGDVDPVKIMMRAVERYEI
jgi:hypothetical protein